jgi:tRNA(adenine34) deaminase
MRDRTNDERMMRRCFDLAVESVRQGGYPFGAIIAKNDRIVVEAINRTAKDRDVMRHAEVVALSEAQNICAATSLDDCTLYSNVEPCALCSYAIREARISRVVYGLRSPIMGGVTRWNILEDRTLSDTMPEVFAPPPEILKTFLVSEADLALRRASPLIWAGVRWRGLFDTDPVVNQPPETIRIRKNLYLRGMRLLRNHVFDRFGRSRA